MGKILNDINYLATIPRTGVLGTLLGLLSSSLLTLELAATPRAEHRIRKPVPDARATVADRARPHPEELPRPGQAGSRGHRSAFLGELA